MDLSNCTLGSFTVFPSTVLCCNTSSAVMCVLFKRFVHFPFSLDNQEGIRPDLSHVHNQLYLLSMILFCCQLLDQILLKCFYVFLQTILSIGTIWVSILFLLHLL